MRNTIKVTEGKEWLGLERREMERVRSTEMVIVRSTETGEVSSLPVGKGRGDRIFKNLS